MRPDACGICLLKQTASGAQSVTSPSKIEGFREFEADLSALFSNEKRFLFVNSSVFFKCTYRKHGMFYLLQCKCVTRKLYEK